MRSIQSRAIVMLLHHHLPHSMCHHLEVQCQHSTRLGTGDGTVCVSVSVRDPCYPRLTQMAPTARMGRNGTIMALYSVELS